MIDHSALPHMLHPCDVECFLHDVWGKTVTCYRRSLGRNAGNILSLEGFELMLATLNRADQGWLHLAHGGLKPIPPGMVDEDGMLDLRKVRAAFSGGETLYLTKVERLSPSVMHLCRAIELDLLAHGVGLRKSVNAHVFLTPPDSQGFPAHRDEHASFVIQLEGSKEWTVYEPSSGTNESPIRTPRPGVVDLASLEHAKEHRFHLQTGDVLYMPEWWPHEARASRSHSLHLTLRIFPLRWVDLILELCTDHPALSASIPFNAATKPNKLLKPLVDLLHSREFLEPLDSRVDSIICRRVVPRTLLPQDGLRQALMIDRVELTTTLERHVGTVCMVFEAGDEVCIGFPGGVIRGPLLIKEVFEYIASTPTLRPCDLPAISGREYDRLGIARTMIRDGLLRIANRTL